MRVRSDWRFACLLAAIGCVGTAPPASWQETPVNAWQIIRPDELRESSWTTLDDAVRILRPEWLRTRGPSSLSGRPDGVQVLIDGVPIGGVESLGMIGVGGIVSVRFYDPIAASTRWGRRFGGGAIAISTRVSR